jgi:hypothetical protein
MTMILLWTARGSVILFGYNGIGGSTVFSQAA